MVTGKVFELASLEQDEILPKVSRSELIYLQDKFLVFIYISIIPISDNALY